MRSAFNDEKMEYITEMREKALHDEATAMNADEKRGMEKGLEKGIEKGRAEVVEKMRKIGMTEEQINSILKSWLSFHQLSRTLQIF